MIFLASRVCSPPTERTWRGEERNGGRRGGARHSKLRNPSPVELTLPQIMGGNMDIQVTQLVRSRAEARKRVP